MGHGQVASAAISGSTPMHTIDGQRAAGHAPSPCATSAAPGQAAATPSQPSRPQQGQVKLTMAQLMQLTQSAQVRGPLKTLKVLQWNLCSGGSLLMNQSICEQDF